MRTIKFRGKYYHGEWLYGFLQKYSKKFNSRLCVCATSVTSWKDALIYQVLEETVGQFTGLYDKNGKEIYEGDILVWGENDCKSQPMIVVFKHGSFGYTYIEDWFHSFAGNTNFTFNPLNTDVRFEIVGNIHDNPELLKGGTK